MALTSAIPGLILEEHGHTGRSLGKYRVLLELARGGMGVVSLAVLRGPGGFHKLLAVKELRAEFVRTPALVAMFIDEARLAARLSHPNVVQTIEVGVEEDRPFLAMEYLDGQPLRQVVQRALALSMRIPLRAHLGILLDVLSALEYAHGLTDFDGKPLGVVHRDVSPHNVVVTYDGQVKLVDFGSSKAGKTREEQPIADHPSADERADIVMGKARYMSPEQVTGGQVDQRADIFAVGVMMWEAIVGKRPWEGQPDGAVLQNLASGALPRMTDAWPDVDPGLGAIVDRAMAARPEERYSTAHAMRTELERYIAARNLAPQSARSLGASVARLFADDREKLRSVIDARIRALSGSDHAKSSTMPRLAMTLPAAGGQLASEVPSERRPSGASSALASAPLSLPAPTITSPSAPPVALPAGDATVRSAVRPVPVPVPKRVAAIAVGAAVLGAAVAFIFVGLARSRPADTGATVHVQPVAAAAPAAPHAGPPSESVPAPTIPAVLVAATSGSGRSTRTIVVASPASAHIFLDDSAVSNPYVADHPADAVAHRLRVEAPGYETKTRILTFAEDVQLELDLTATPSTPSPRPAKVERSAPAEPPAARRAAAVVDAPAPTRAPRPIDTGDPYLR